MTRLHHGHGPLVHDDGTVTFRVWAPRAEQVELLLEGRATPMEADDGGWFALRTAAVHGGAYAFRLDGGPERPDPASRWQPDGVHGRSRVLDVARLPWSGDETAWRGPGLGGAVIYEVHIGTFTRTGTFDAAIVHLPRLVELGITHVEIMPVNAYSGDRGWGYDGVAWYAVHEPYGGPEGLARFVDACHRTGLGVILDVVYNHLGPSGNYLPEFGPYLTERYGSPWGPAVNLDGPGSREVRRFVVDNARQWLRDFHLDGLRLDAVHALIDLSATHVLAELADAAGALELELRRPLLLVAESDRNDPLTVTPRERGGMGITGQWVDDLHHAIHTAVTGEQDGYYVDYSGLADVAYAYQRGFVFDGRHSIYRDCRVGAPLTDQPAWRLVACIQNHDQVGNRAFGERLTQLVDSALVRVAAVLLAAAPHTPMLFMGEEYGETRPFLYFSGHPEPDLAEAVRSGRREEFAAFDIFAADDVPDPQDPATRDASRLDQDAADTDAGLARQRLWRQLFRLRREQPALANARGDLVDVLEVDDTGLALVRRTDHAPSVLVTVNLRSEPRSFRIAGAWRALLDTDAEEVGGPGGGATTGGADIVQPPRSATIWTPADR